jgi:hypothetical protein
MHPFHIVTVTATIINPEGKEIFRSSHEATEKPDASTKALFSSLIHPMELVLSDAHKQFAQPPTDPTPSDTAQP